MGSGRRQREKSLITFRVVRIVLVVKGENVCHKVDDINTKRILRCQVALK